MKHLSARIARRLVLASAIAGLGFSHDILLADPSATPPATRPIITQLPATQPSVAVARLAVPTTGPSAAPAMDAGKIDVGKLINQLGSDDSDDRDSAQKQLVQLGQPAMVALKKAAQSSDDPEIRSRAAAALAQIKEHDDNDASLMTLHMKDASAQDVLSSISAQSHSQITTFAFGRMPGVDNRSVTIDVDAQPFWDVMTDVCNQLNLCPELAVLGKNQMRLQPMARNWMQSPHEVVGPFWIGAAGVYRTRSIDLQGPVLVDDQFSVRLIVCPEPKLAVAQISDLNLKEATDDLGHSLIPPAAPNRNAIALHLLRGFNQNSRTIESHLQYPEHPGRTIAILSGDLNVMVSQDVQQYIVDNVMGSQKITNPLKNCNVITTCIKQGASDTYVVTIDCTRDGLSDEQWTAMINRTNDVVLEDGDGHPLAPLTFALPGQSTETSYTCRAYFSRNSALGMINRPAVIIGGAAAGVAVGGAAAPATKVGEPKRLTWNVATSLKTIKVPVELKDLPMP
jgi:hypothetical protein